MKKKLIIFIISNLFCIFNNFYSSEKINNTNNEKQALELKPGSSVQYLYPIIPGASPYILIANNIDNNQKSFVKTAVETNFTQLQAQVKNYFEGTKDKINLNFQKIISYIFSNKYKIILTTFIVFIVFIVIKIKFLEKKIVSPALWMNWKATTLELPYLLATSYNEVLDLLLKDINKKYISNANLNNMDIPLSCFIADIKKEKIILNEYLKLYSFFQHIYFIKNFLFDSKIIADINLKLTRLNFIYDIFIKWFTDKNLFNL